MKDSVLPAPPAALISRNPLQWVRVFGPGAVMASVTIGSGELVFPSRGGSIFGYRLLWVFLVVGFLKWVLAYSSIRHMVLSGSHPLERWISLPGPRGWLHLFLLLCAVFTMPLTYAFLLGILGTACSWIFTVGDYYFWASICVAAAVVLLLVGGYGFLEKAQTVILGVMLGCILIAVFYLRPDWIAIAKGLVPQPLSYADWLFTTLPEMRDRSIWVEVLVYVSVIGGTAPDYFAYTSFLREKGWGRSRLGPASKEQLELMADPGNRAPRVWLRAPLVDSAVSFVAVVVISCAFCILGTVVLRPEHLVPEGINLLNYQGAFLTSLSPWLLPLYQVGVFMAFFGSIYAGPEIYYRIIYEILHAVPRWRGRVPKGKLRGAVYGLSLGGGLLTLWLTRMYPGIEPLDLYTPVAIFTGFLLTSLYTLANPWTDWRFLPVGLRMPGWLAGANIFAAAVFLVGGLKALWDYGQVSACLTVAVPLAACALLVVPLRFLFEDQTPGAPGVNQSPRRKPGEGI